MIKGNLYERNGIYYAVISYYEDGKRKQKSVSTKLPVKGNKRKATEFLDALIRKYEKKEQMENLEGDSILFVDFMEEWFKTIRPTIERATYGSYEQLYKSRIKPHFEKLNLALSEIKPQHIQMLYDEILSEGCVTNTVIHYHAIIRKALAYAVKMQIIPVNPADLVARPKKNRYIAKYYTKEETAVLLEMARDDPIYIPILLAAYYGLRRSEVLGLRWSAVDFEKKTLTVNHKVAQVREEGKLVVYAEDKLKTKSSYRTLPLIPFVEEELLKLKKRQEERRRVFRKSYSREYLDYICVNEKGELFKPNYISGHFRWFLEKHGLKVIRFHELRHYYASMMLANNVLDKYAMKHMGHATNNMLKSIYQHTFDEKDKEITETINSYLETGFFQ